MLTRLSVVGSELGEGKLAEFLSAMTLEITPRHVEKLSVIEQHLPKGAHVYIALVDPAEVDAQLAASKALSEAGFNAVPHVPARFVKDKDDLEDRVARLVNEGGAQHMLVLGGGAPEPLGQYDAAIQLLETGVFARNGVKKIGIAGHPEGNPDITKIHGEAALLSALTDKQAFLKENGYEAYIATQFLFEAAPVAEWAKGLRDAGIELPVNVGIPGPATIKTLVKFAALCGVGNSARFIRKQAMKVTKLLTDSAPDDFIRDLAVLHFEKPELGIARPHFYPFGGYDKLFKWLGPKMG